MQDYKTVNGVKGSGGAIDGPGPVVVNGMVFVNSGYMRFGGAPGNVLARLRNGLGYREVLLASYCLDCCVMASPLTAQKTPFSK